jgi:ABC-type phosphate/phosphonate transport system substrate-binding protein
MLVANARMYAVNPVVWAAWAALFERVSTISGVPLTVIEHAAPAPLEELWRRGDLGLAFICGFPFAALDFGLQPIAAPIPAGPLAAGRPFYASDLIVRADGPFRTLEETFGGRIGWTARHSQSGFQAPRRHLLPYRRGVAPLYRESIGELMTPRRVIEAVLDDRIDIGPLDSYFHDLLKRHEPDTAARLRVVATTEPTPMPLLAASPTLAPADRDALRRALLALGDDPLGRSLLAALCLSGFASVAAEDYAPLLASALAVDAAGYAEPG